MGKFFDEIPSTLIPWIQKQKMFWVATAPLSGTGHVNVSPKGYSGTFHIVDSRRVWYEDLTGSGNETISHLRESGNGRITILFSAFEGAPRIVRLFGTGSVHEFGTPEYESLVPIEKRQPGSRSVITIDVHKVGSSCGYSVPLYTFTANRKALHQGWVKAEAVDIASEESCSAEIAEPPRPDHGLKKYWYTWNKESMDGLPGLASAHESLVKFKRRPKEETRWDEEEATTTATTTTTKQGWVGGEDWRVQVGFLLGLMVGILGVQARALYFSL